MYFLFLLSLPLKYLLYKLQFSYALSFLEWSRKWQPTLVFLLGKAHGQRRLAGVGGKGSDVTEHRHTHTHTHTHTYTDTHTQTHTHTPTTHSLLEIR